MNHLALTVYFLRHGRHQLTAAFSALRLSDGHLCRVQPVSTIRVNFKVIDVKVKGLGLDRNDIGRLMIAANLEL